MLDRKDHLLLDRDVGLDLFARGKIAQWTFIVQVERVAIGVGLPVGASEAKCDSGVSICFLKRLVELLTNDFERQFLRECKIQVLGEAIIGKVTLFERRTALEEQPVSQSAL